jgi:hypothetical protein
VATAEQNDNGVRWSDTDFKKERTMRHWKTAAAAALALAGLGSASGLGQVGAPRAWTNSESGMEVLTRGPVHEAFAETITFDPEPGIGVRRPPPEPIEELPPDQMPEGANVDWIPGYWAWDDERGDFLWISGVWRDLPPGRAWEPGYWARSGPEYQWVSGYWADEQRDQIEYLPEPPATVELGPNISAPSEDYSWIPGSWVWVEGRYAWRPGYWMIVQADWDWVPSHYVYAPRGYVYLDGYWDHPVARRGVLFAPVYFSPHVYGRRGLPFAPVYVDSRIYVRPGYTYTPTTVISLSVFSDHLFVRPQYNHYYFGDYYAASYRDSGFYASFSFQSSRRGYDPIYAHQRWRHRHEPEWGRRVEANFSYRRDHEDARPRRTLAAQLRYSDSDARRGDRSISLATSVEKASRDNHDGVRFRRVGDDERHQVVQRVKGMQRFRENRKRAETDVSVDRSSDRSEPIRTKAHRSPISAKRGEQLGKGKSPPKRPDTPKPDHKVERKPKKKFEKHKRGGKP